MKLPIARKVAPGSERRRRRLPEVPARARALAGRVPLRVPSVPGGSKVRAGLLAGLASGLIAAAVTLLRRRARRRAERRNAEFDRASEGLWPKVEADPGSEVRISTERAATEPATSEQASTERAATERAGTGNETAATEANGGDADQTPPAAPAGRDGEAEPTGDGTELRVIEGGAEEA